MNHRTDPTPRTVSETESGFFWPIRNSIRCRAVEGPEARYFSEIFEARRSTREMSPLPLKDVVNTVAYVCLPRARKVDDSAVRTRRPTISAGALHPISVVIVHGCRSLRAFLYDPLTHTLKTLDASGSELVSLSEKARTVLPNALGTRLVFLADPAQIDAWYEVGCSLFWRDAGALMQSIALAATAFRQAFCPLGILGHEVPKALNAEGQLIACGVALLGRQLP